MFTAVVYYRGGEGDLEHKSFAVISDDLSHDKRSVYAFNKAILEEVRKITPVTKVHYWSDGEASQFKNRYNLANILFHEQDFEAKATWSFFETGPLKTFKKNSHKLHINSVTSCKKGYYTGWGA